MKLIAIAIAALALGACGTKTVPGPTRYVTNDVPGPTVYETPQTCQDAIIAYDNTVSGFLNRIGGETIAQMNVWMPPAESSISARQGEMASACDLQVRSGP